MTNDDNRQMRFHLSTLLLLITCCALFFGWVADSYRHRRFAAEREEEHQAGLLKLERQTQAKLTQLTRKLGRYRQAGAVATSFQVLSFRKQSITDEQIRFMARFPELRKLELSHTNLTPEKLELISELSQLESLNLAHNPSLTDESLACLQKMPRLRELEMTACKGITAAGVKQLYKVRSLERVRLDPRLRHTAAGLVRAVPNCRVVFVNLGKIESFGILAESNNRLTLLEKTLRQQREESLDPTNKRRFGSRKQAPVRSKSAASNLLPAGNDPEQQSKFLQDLESFIADTSVQSRCDEMLRTSHVVAERALQEVSAPKRAFYLLARLNRDRANPELGRELFKLRFSVVKRVAMATFWPHLLSPRSSRQNPNSAYFVACEKIEGKTAVNLLYVMSSKPMQEIQGLTLTHKRMFVAAVERPETHFGKALYGDIGRYLYKTNSVQRFDCRGSSAEIPDGMKLPTIDITNDQTAEWTQNSYRTPIWSVPFLPDLGPVGSEHVRPQW